MAKQRQFSHEIHFLDWFNEDFPVFTLQEWQRILGRRVDEIMQALNNYFTPDYVERSENAQYLKPDIEEIREAYRKKDLVALGEALEGFKFSLEWL